MNKSILEDCISWADVIETLRVLNENEHVLTSPELIGTDQEKIQAIKYWAELIGLLRTLNSSMVSFNNKINIIDAIKIELDLIGAEVNNHTAEFNPDSDIPSMTQSAGDEPVVVNTTIDAKQSFPPESIDRMKRAAGIEIPVKSKQPGPGESRIEVVPEPEELKSFAPDAINKLQRMAGVR